MSAAVDSPPDDYHVALRHAMERMRAIAEERSLYHCSWQTSEQRVFALQEELAAQGRNLETLQAELASLRGHDAACAEAVELRVKSDALETKAAALSAELTAVRAEAASLSERLAAATSENESITKAPGFRLLSRLRTFRWHLRRWRDRILLKEPATPAAIAAMPPVSTDPPAPSAVPLSLPTDLPGTSDRPPSLAGETPISEEAKALEGVKVRTVEELDYSPARWKLDKPPADADQSLRLMILSANHRAGSTLLQRICNAREKTLIWGEHGGVLRHFADLFGGLAYCAWAGEAERDAYFQKGENPNTWIANMCPDLQHVRQAVVDSARAFLTTLYNEYRDNHDILGFKEVLYGRREIELLRQCCPRAHLFLLVRNPVNTWKSTPRHWWWVSVEHWIESWNAAVECFRKFAAADPLCHLIRYEDLIVRTPETMAVLQNVAQVTPEQIESVLACRLRGHSEPPTMTDAEKGKILTRCRESMGKLGYL